jgi:hypothetical protein
VHTEAYEWVARYATDDPVTVLDLGGRDINGSPRGLFPNADYLVLDLVDGPNVDIVADAAIWDPYTWWDIVVCCEVCEHTLVWRDVLGTAALALRPGGRLIVTTAAPGRAPHSGIDGGEVRPGEYYANVEPDQLELALRHAGLVDVVINVNPASADVRATAMKPEV